MKLLRAPASPRTVIDSVFLAVGFPLGVLASTAMLTLISVGLSLAVTAVLALPCLAALLWSERIFTSWQLARFRDFLGVDLPAAPEYRGAPGAWPRRLWARAATAGVWRRIGYHALSGIVSTFTFLLVFGLWIAGVCLGSVAAWSWLLPPYGGLFGHSVHGAGRIIALTLTGIAAFFLAAPAARLLVRLETSLAVALLSISRTERLSREVAKLTRSRSDVVDAADAERRRIERDLHDGAQQRLVSLAMDLGMTRAMLTEVPDEVRAGVERAHEQAKQALVELRDFVRGLHPAVLDDLGLDAALSGIAARSSVPVRLLVELRGRPPAAVETVAYFVVSEALSNAVKHSRATRVDIVVEQLSAVLRIIVSDNGVGGADASRGSGIRGLGQRVRSLDGTMTVDSPPGGPTLVLVELPCAS
jgi:signal transduction histidine kinase